MALAKSVLNINFAQGLDTKTDPFQVAPGRFLNLENSVFDKGGLLQKRNGYGLLSTLPDTSSTYVTTFNSNLIAVGTQIQAYNAANAEWVSQGEIQPLKLDTLSLIRSNTNQSYADCAFSQGLVITAFTDNIPNGSSTTPVYKYVIADAVTGQNIVAPTVIVPTIGTIIGAPKVYTLGNYFVLVYSTLVLGVNHLVVKPISVLNPNNVYVDINVTNRYIAHSTGAFDAVVANNNLFLAWNSTDVGGGMRATKVDSTLNLYLSVIISTHGADYVSLCADASGVTPVMYAAFYDSNTQDGYTAAFDPSLALVLAETQIISGIDALNITSSAQNQAVQVFYEVDNNYGYDAAIPTHYINTLNVTQTGVVGSTTVSARGVGLASKSFIISDSVYYLGVYYSTFQPSYFLLSQTGKVISKLAYSNGGGYYTTGLPNATVISSSANIPYLIKNQIQAVNKDQGASSPAGIYSQLGVNLASFMFNSSVPTSSETGSNLNLPGGFLWAYDGYAVTENNFFLWPDYLESTNASTGGNLSAQQYYYIATYEWADNQGNVFRSAPSIPLSVDLTASMTSTNSVTVNVPTLRLTYKTANPVKLVLYRWSQAQQTYYQTTSISNPILNDTTVDYVAIVDNNADSSIIGNNILYTTGGVVENISPPGFDTITLFQSRLFGVDSEDKNLLWYSKQVIEDTPVEMSDLFTIFVSPTISAQGNTGPITALSAMDDKLIIYKANAIYYVTGTGPDNTGSNNQFSEPVFITATVGSINQKSIALIPNGLMFQSNKGYWLLGRDLQTNYIGAPVQQYTQDAVALSAVVIPGTNQVRITMSSGITLLYDYYYGQWSTFTNVPAISSTLYQDLQTYINVHGKVYQETPGSYLDGTNPVLMSFTTSWFNLAGLQGFQRAYEFNLLGTYISPHKLTISIAYDYNSSPTQVTVVNPINPTPNWGGLAQWGSSPAWGGPGNIEQWRIFMDRQKCQSFQITIKENYNSSYGQAAGAGFTMSGLNLVVGVKTGYPKLRAGLGTS